MKKSDSQYLTHYFFLHSKSLFSHFFSSPLFLFRVELIRGEEDWGLEAELQEKENKKSNRAEDRGLEE